MKIIYISHWRFPSEKTMSPLIMRTCSEFARVGNEVELWAAGRGNKDFLGKDAFIYHNIPPNFKIIRIPVLDLMEILPGKIYFFIMLATFNISVLLRAMIGRFGKENVFYFHDARDSVLLLPFVKRKFLEIHDFYKSNINSLNKFVFKRMNGFIVTNRHKMDLLKKDFGIAEEKMLHRPNGVDIRMFDISVSKPEARAALGLSTEAKIILYTGHLFSWKGVDTLFDSHAFLGENEVIYFVGGTDEDIKKFEDKSKDIKDKIVVVGRRPHTQMPTWLKAADVLVLPNTAKEDASKYETSPVKLFEYMCSGTPIVASDLPSIRNVVDEKSVFFFTPDNPQSLAFVIGDVFKNSQEAEKKAAHARRKEVENYSWDRRTSSILKFLKNLNP